MSSTTDKLKGAANEVAGNVKLQAEGKAQELKGEAQRTVGETKDVIKDKTGL